MDAVSGDRTHKSVALEHSEWLSLLDVDGPFLSLPVLLDVFPQGLERVDAARRQQLRHAHQAWLDDPKDPRIHMNWVEVVLQQALEFDRREESNWDTAEWYLDRFGGDHPVPESLVLHKAEYGETVEPAFLVRNPDDGPEAERARMLVIVHDREQDLVRPIRSSGWKDLPATRAEQLCKQTGVQLALLTNGHQWMLVDAPRDHTRGTALWTSELFFAEPITLQAFQSLLSQQRFFSVADEETPEGMLDRSRKDQFDVTDQLGRQVRQAIEILVGCLQRANVDENGDLLESVSPERIYEASVSVMMRLIVLLCAEERGLLDLDEPIYREAYAVSTLGDQLRAESEGVLETRTDAWYRLLALFRMVHGGVAFDRFTIQGYGGQLFDPDRFPFLEGRDPGTAWRDGDAKPLPIDNRTVLHVLDALQRLRIRFGGETFPRKLSFKALGIEQIGHVYESLLDHNAVRADEPVLGLVGKAGEEAEVRLSLLEELAAKKGTALANKLKELGVGSSAKVVKNKLDDEVAEERLDRLQHQCDAADAADTGLWDRVRPFAGIVRDDDFGQPIVVPVGGVFVTQGMDRRASGSHYTTRDLTEPIVERTLEPQVFVGPAEGLPKEDWTLKSPGELLGLKILDPACGSGAFLVQSCRYLADRLVESWAEALAASDGHLDVEGRPLSGRAGEVAIPDDVGLTRVHLAQRLIVQRCLYGVDKNHLAVEMAKLSLWLLVLARDEPFTFLDHAIKCGDSLVGLSAEQVKALDWQSLASPLFAELDDATREAATRRGEIVGLGVGHEEEKALLHRSAETALADAKLVGDVVVAAFFKGTKDKVRRAFREEARTLVERWKAGKVERSALEAAAAVLQRGEHPLSPFHWELEFPEVFGRENPGFDAVVGNPPFLGGTKISSSNGATFLHWLGKAFDETKGSADLVAYFFRRSFVMLSAFGTFGMIATNTISQGDTRYSGLRWIVGNGGVIYGVRTRVRWPGAAAVMVSIIHVCKGDGRLSNLLDHADVPCISAYLVAGDRSDEPEQLFENAGRSFNGAKVDGIGFTVDESDSTGKAITPTELEDLLEREPQSASRIFPYLGGSDLNRNPRHIAGRRIVNFGMMSLDEASRFPLLLKEIELRVKPERDTQNRDARKRYWWRYGEPAPSLVAALRSVSHALVVCKHTKHLLFGRVSADQVFSNALNVFTLDSWHAYAALQSRPHEIWARFFGSSMKDDLRYTPSVCFDTFPFSGNWANSPTLEAAGQAYYEYRADLMVEHDEGLTKTYNRFHDPDETNPRILKLRELHAAMDRAVLDAYGWDDLSTNCEFVPDYEPEEGETAPVRYRWPEAVHDEVLARLLELNAQRHQEETASETIFGD